MSIQTIHEVTSEEKVQQIAESMMVNGWIGNPVLVDDEDSNEPTAFTGTHRIAAAAIAGIEVPMYSLEQVGVDCGEMMDCLDDEDRLEVIEESGDEEAIRIMQEEVVNNCN